MTKGKKCHQADLETANKSVDEVPVDEGMEIDADDQDNTLFSRKEFDPDAYGPIEVPPAPDRVATYSVDGPRLMITHIENYFFKSYAGKRTLGPFNKCFTAIVGPNGSGKSNVIDSMLFVFGYRASKIRSKKISVLIHHSDRHPDVQSCTVTVYFQTIKDTGPGDDDYDVMEGSKFSVSRTASRDNSSFYTVDGVRTTYKDVAVLLRSKGIDLDHNRFLILQGEVEQIAMMKPKAQSEHDEGMLEFLEDIIGSSRYQKPIEMLYKRVEELNEFRAEKINRVKAVEKEKNNLEGPKDEALVYLKLENDIMLRKNVLYHKYIQECTVEVDKGTVERDRIKESKASLTQKLDTIAKTRDEQRVEHKNTYTTYERLKSECDELKAKFAEFEKQDVKCREDLKHGKVNSKKIEKNIEREKKKVENLKNVPEESERTISKLKCDLEKLEQDKKMEEDNMAVVLDGLKNETKDLQKEKENKERELLELQKSVNASKSKYEVTKAELDLCLSTQQKETARLDTLNTNLERASSMLRDKQQEIKKLEQGIADSTTSLQKASKDLKVVTDAKDKTTAKLSSLRSKVEVAKSSIDSVKSRGRVLEGLMSQKQNNNIPGIYGRLGDLGGIDDRYDVAVSTACGMLDHIVCDTIKTAQACVEYLKATGSGVASFIGLDKMEKWLPYTTKRITTPENVPRLFDLIKVQNKDILPAFYFALRDTLVAKDLDQATRIAYGATRYRVVTLQGQLIDQSGTMSGGGKSVCKGRMGSSAVVASDYTPDQLRSMEAELQKVEADAEQCVSNKEHLEDTVEQLEKDVAHMKQSLQKCVMDVKATAEQECVLKSQVKEQEERVKVAAPDEKKVKDLQNHVGIQKKEYDEVAATASKVEAAIKNLHSKIMDYGGTKITAVQTRIDAVCAKMDQATGLVTKTNVAVKTAERNLKKAEDKVASLENELKENAANMENLEKLFKQIEVDASAVLERNQACQDEIKEVETVLHRLKGEQTKLDQEEDMLQKENIEVEHELEKYEGIVKENQLRVKHWKQELGRMKLNKIERNDPEDLPAVCNSEIQEVDNNAMKYEITIQEEKLAHMKPNMAAIDEYRKKEDAYLEKVAELEKITDMRNQQRGCYDELRKQRLNEFMDGFGVITNKLKEMYRMITLGGDAELELVDSLDPFSEGIVFSVRPRFKSWKNICNLSGGEKTLSSLALVFALHHYKPTPLYVMDEIDAALDFKNVSIVGNYIKDRTKNAQFIIISLRNNMFELADRLVGIYKTYDCTKSVTINPRTLHIPPQDPAR